MLLLGSGAEGFVLPFMDAGTLLNYLTTKSRLGKLTQLPPNCCLQSLTFKPHFDKIMELQLPSSLQSLTFGFFFNQCINNVAFPRNLKSLTFGQMFNKPVDVIFTLCKGLNSLSFGNHFNQPLWGIDKLEDLECLTLGLAFNQTIEEWCSREYQSHRRLEMATNMLFTLPPSLRRLEMATDMCAAYDRLICVQRMFNRRVRLRELIFVYHEPLIEQWWVEFWKHGIEELLVKVPGCEVNWHWCHWTVRGYRRAQNPVRETQVHRMPPPQNITYAMSPSAL